MITTLPTEEQTKAKIRRLNDLARTAMGVASRLVQTCGISALPSAEQSAIREKVEKFRKSTAPESVAEPSRKA